MSVKKIITIALVFVQVMGVSAMSDSLRESGKRKCLIAATGLGFSSGFYLLYQQWYKDYSRGRFVFFDDSREWLGMDKVGHFGTSWFIHGSLAQLARHQGFSRQQANFYGIISTSVFMTSIEVMDGFSKGWGFSWSDYATNLAGIAYSSWQFSLESHNLPAIKYSWQPNALHHIRPEILGTSIASRMLKNYNEQTYWLSIPSSLMHHDLPAWFCISMGYGAAGMLGGNDNIWSNASGVIQNYSWISRRSEWKLSFDIDLTRLPLRKKWQRNLASWLRWIKIPAPTLIVANHSVPQWRIMHW